MAVVNSASNLFRDALTLGAMPDTVELRGKLYTAVGIVLNLTSDNTGSTYKLATLPSDCILHPSTVFDVQNWGFAQVVIGSLLQTDDILDVAKSAAALQSPVAWGNANHNKRLWEWLGLSADPGGTIDIYAHAEGNATADGNMPFAIAYLHHG